MTLKQRIGLTLAFVMLSAFLISCSSLSVLKGAREEVKATIIEPVKTKEQHTLNAIAFINCNMLAFYVIEADGQLFLIRFSDMEKNPQLRILVGDILAKIELSGGAPVSVFLEKELGLLCV